MNCTKCGMWMGDFTVCIDCGHENEPLPVRSESAGSVSVVAGRVCDCSNEKLEKRLCFFIEREFEKPEPDIHLIAVMSDSVRNIRQFTDAMNED